MKTKISILFVLLALTGPCFADFQGAWISSVYNINFPSQSGLSMEAQKGEAQKGDAAHCFALHGDFALLVLNQANSFVSAVGNFEKA